MLTPRFLLRILSLFRRELYYIGGSDVLPPPLPRESDLGMIGPMEPYFSGFIFKIQADCIFVVVFKVCNPEHENICTCFGI